MKSVINNLSIILIVCSYTITCNHAAELDYEFGVDNGEVIYTVEGIIPLLKYDTTINIPVPKDVKITYVKVTVDSLSPPKVDYDSVFKQVFIKYTWIQATLSTYKILAKGVHIE